MVGNFPQALSHIALVHAAFAMSGTWTPPHAVEQDAANAASTAADARMRGKPGESATKGRRKRS
jgi:hypothetical protein